MSKRAVFSLPVRQALEQPCLRRTPPRNIHTQCLRQQPLRDQHRLSQRLRTSPQWRRHFARDSTGSVLGNLRILLRAHPIAIPTALICIIIASGGVFYANWLYQTYIIGAFHKYPEEVAKKLRRALYYTNTDLNATEAVKYYRQALQVAEEVGMDPMSDEVMGVKIQVAGLMERIERYEKAVEVLERVRNDNLRWLEERGDVQRPPHEEVREGGEEGFSLSDWKQKRTRILAKTVAISVKLGEHYANPAIWDRDTAVERLVWAVETVEKEKRRRTAARATDATDGPWISDEEQGASIEALAHGYEEKGMHYLATPLFLQALSLKASQDCHSVILMNNVATSLAQQSPRAARAVSAAIQSNNIKDPAAPSGPVATRETMLENAKLWAQKGLDMARSIQPPERDEECDMGCAVATHNLGEFAEMLRQEGEARRLYKEAISLSRAIGFRDGVEQSSERLRKLEGAG